MALHKSFLYPPKPYKFLSLMSTPNFDCFYSQRLKVTRKTSGLLPPFKTSSQSANQWPSREMKPMSKLITCHPGTRYMHSCWKLGVWCYLALPSTLPVPFKTLCPLAYTSRNSFQEALVVGTGFWRAPEVHANTYYAYYMSIAVNSARHICVPYVHCCELSKAFHAQEIWKSRRTQHRSCDKV